MTEPTLPEPLPANYETGNTFTAGDEDLVEEAVNLDTAAIRDLQEKVASGAGAYVKPSGGIPESDLASALQAKIDNAGSGAYVKPSGGIPASDLAGNIPASALSSDVQSKLTAAGTALQTISSTNISDSTSLGRSLVTASSQAIAREALGPLLFDARDWGVKADGLQHNNVANLMDCINACAAAGGGIVQLPAGKIITSEAVYGATVTADSGATYTNNGGIPIPTNTVAGVPLWIRGHGSGSTILKLSAGMPRAFDFWYTQDGQVYQDLRISDMTVDRTGVTGASTASGTVGGSSPITISTGNSNVTIPGLTKSQFLNATSVYHPASQTMFGVSFSGTTVLLSNPSFSNPLTTTSCTINPGDTITGALGLSHVVVGNRAGPWPSNQTFNRVLIENVVGLADPITVPPQAPSPLSLPIVLPDQPQFVYFGVSPRSTAQNAINTSQGTNILVRHCNFSGGSNGVQFEGSGWYDNVWIDDTVMDTLQGSIGNWGSTGFMFGAACRFGRAGVTRCTISNSGDPALEVDNAWDFTERDNKYYNNFSNVNINTYMIPCRTSDGPRTCVLQTSMANSSTTITSSAGFINTMPSDVDPAGLVQIDAELCWYNAIGTTWTVYRGINGSTVSAHSANSTITFVEDHKPRFRSINPVFVNDTTQARAAYCLGSPALNGKSPGLPPVGIRLPRLDIRDGTYTMVGGNIYNNFLISSGGWLNRIDMQGISYLRNNLASNYNSGAVDGIINLTSPSSGLDPALVPIPPAVLYGRNNEFRVFGSASLQVATIGGSPTGGSFTLTYGGVTTASIAYNATSTAVMSALTAAGISAATSVSGNAGGPYSIQFSGVATQLTATGSFTGGTSPSISTAPGTVMTILQPWGGYWKFDFEFSAHMQYSGGGASSIYAAYLCPWGAFGGAKLIVAKGSRIGFTGRHLTALDSVTAPAFAYIGSTNYMTIQERLDLSLNLADWQFATSSSDGNYVPLVFSASGGSAQTAASIPINSVNIPSSASLPHPVGYTNGAVFSESGVNVQTGTSYTLAITDSFVTLNNSSAITLTVPPNSSVPFPIGSTIYIAQLGAGQVTVAGGSGVTVHSALSGSAIAAQYQTARLTQTSTNTWLLAT